MNPAICQQYRAASRLGGCTNRASFRYTWPGKPESTVCKTCSHKLRNVAAAMGFILELVPIDEPRRDTTPAPPLHDAVGDDDPPWMLDTQPTVWPEPGRDVPADIAPSSSKVDRGAE
jgi:hypothetical protein